MKQVIVLFALIIFSYKIVAQTKENDQFFRTDFVKTSWFIDNKNGAFLKNDTLTFIKHTNKAIHNEYKEYKENEMEYLGHGYFIELDLYRGNSMQFLTRIDNAITMFDFKEYRWKFNNKTQSLLIYKEGNLLMRLKPIKRRKIKVPSNDFRDKELIETKEITFVRMRYTVKNASWFDMLRTLLKFKM